MFDNRLHIKGKAKQNAEDLNPKHRRHIATCQTKMGLSALPTVEGMTARKDAEIDAIFLSRSATDVAICFLFNY